MRHLVLSLLICLLTACGQAGALYLPDPAPESTDTDDASKASKASETP